MTGAGEFPDVVLEVLFDQWTDITSHLKTFTFSWGRSRETDRPEAGTATFLVDNFDRSFEPGNKASPHYPDVRPRRPIRINAIVESAILPFTIGSSFISGPDVLGGGASTIPLFTGNVESWSNDWPSNGFDATATIQASDAFKVLAEHPLQQGPTHAYAGDQVDDILDIVGWSLVDRDVDHEALIMALTITDVIGHTALEYLLTVAVSDGGVFFAGRDGKLVYRGPHHAMNDPLEFGGGTTDILYEDVSVSSDDLQLWNDITVQTSGAADMTALDARSVERYFDLPLSMSSFINNDVDRAWRARQMLVAYSEPQQRVASVSHVRAQDDWGSILNRDLGDYVNVSIAPPGGGAEIYQQSRIERITIESNGRHDWRVRWELSALPRRNLLTDDLVSASTLSSQTTAATSLAGWASETNCSIARVTPSGSNNPVLVGVAVMQLSATAGGDMSAVTTPSTQIPVVVGNRYVASAWFAPGTAGTTHRSVRVDISWRDSGGSLVSNTVGDVVAETPIVIFVPAWAEGLAPAGAVYAIVRVTVIGASAAEKHDVDLILLTTDD